MICTSLEGNEETAFYGVFDGHGGTYTSEFWFVFVFESDAQQKPPPPHIAVPARVQGEGCVCFSASLMRRPRAKTTKRYSEKASSRWTRS